MKTQQLHAIGLLSTLLALSACGGGAPTAPGTPSTLTGAVMDGYIKGAKVCLDTNANLLCDDDINTQSGENGGYKLTIPVGVDASQYHVVADVVAGAIDSDSPNTPVSKPYTLLAPATDAGVISPLTTFVSHAMIETPSLNLAEAKSDAIKQLNLPQTTDFAKDYIAKADKTTHNLAIMAASVLGQVQGDTVTAVAPTTAAEFIQARKRALKEARATIGDYAKTAADTSADVGKIKTAAAQSAKDNIEKIKTALKDNVKQQASLGGSKPLGVLDFFKTDSLFDVRSYSASSTPIAGGATYIEGLNLSQISSAVGELAIRISHAQKTNTNWASGEGDSDVQDNSTSYQYSYAQKKWGPNNSNGTSGGSLTLNPDGVSANFTSDTRQDPIKISFSVLDVSDKKASKVPFLLKNNGSCTNNSSCPNFNDFTLPVGAKVITISAYADQDWYNTWGCTTCGPTYYDNTQKKTLPYPNLAALISATQGGAASSEVSVGSFMFAKFTATSDTTGSIVFLAYPNSSSTPATKNEVGRGAYTITTLGGNKVMLIRVTSELTPGALTSNASPTGVNTPRKSRILVEINDTVLIGDVYHKGLEPQDETPPSMNRVALDAFLKAQGYPAIAP